MTKIKDTLPEGWAYIYDHDNKCYVLTEFPPPEPERLIQELQETNKTYLQIIKQLTNLLNK